MDAAPLLAMRGIDKSFSGVPALTAAELTVGRAEVHALIGQNGAGKSTIIKILTGAHRPDAGSIQFDGSAIAPASPAEAQRLGISTIYQEINLVRYRSVAENVFLGREPRRLGLIHWSRMNADAAALLRQFDIDVDVTLPLGRCSIAVQQMVAIARAVSTDAKLVVMDEPTSSLDDREVEVLFGVIRRLKARGVSVIFVSHRLDELYAVCDRVTVMRDGRTVAQSRMGELGKLDLVMAMLGRRLTESEARGIHGTERAGGAPLLEVEGLRRGHRVRDAGLSVRRGEVVGLAGLLGSGRTEVARMLFGADAPEGGLIRHKGAPARFRAPGEAIRARIGFSSEDRKAEGIIPDMSVRENMTLALLPHLARAGVVDTARQQRIADEFVRRLGIKCASPEQRIRELSGGNQQKVLLARWLCTDPELLILDEPTRGIDVGAKAEILSLVEELADGGLGVLMISSELEELVQGADRVVVLRDGRSVAELEGDALTEDAVMHAMADGGEPAPGRAPAAAAGSGTGSGGVSGGGAEARGG
ncbi:sugar ABC transporter ATP-binding protein [Arenibaculum pallidiluteum]|uniref:sugar ABC transporter ATP-binding protein n=1 Tax=Arenibaculum pallidiluteum TaxID=2812559 RepID=UPI002E2ABAC3|nr:sugar ABC transporter ATP-binding protein [Arenibaculum pallidiluteum]